MAQAVEEDAGVAAQEDVAAAVVPASFEALQVVLLNNDHWFLRLVDEDHAQEILNKYPEDLNQKPEVLNQYPEDLNLKPEVLNQYPEDRNLKEEMRDLLPEDRSHSLEVPNVILLTVPENQTNSYLSEVSLLVEQTRFKVVRFRAAVLHPPSLITTPFKSSTICLSKCKPSD
jgi:hypothetical protein